MSNLVRLKYATLLPGRGGDRLNLFVKVKNIAYEKDVRLHYL